MAIPHFLVHPGDPAANLTAENRGLISAGGQHVEDVLYCDAMTADDGFATENFRIACDALDEFLLFHAP